MEADKVLLGQYAQTQDADAFSQLVERYADLVYNTALRITGNNHDAEDIAQDCFLSLARKAGAIRSSLPGWLHTTTRNASVDLLKQTGKRIAKEREAAMNQTKGKTKGVSWKELEPYIDAALNKLSPEFASALILHYLQNKTQAEVAEIIGIDQSTASRRINKGVDELRKRLRKAGVLLPIIALVSCLKSSPANAAPAALKITLGKMAIAGVGKAAAFGGASGGASSVSTALVSLKVKLGILATAGVLTLGGVVAYQEAKQPKLTPDEIQKTHKQIVTTETEANKFFLNDPPEGMLSLVYPLDSLPESDHNKIIDAVKQRLSELEEDVNPEAYLKIWDNQLLAMQSPAAQYLIGEYLGHQWPTFCIMATVSNAIDMPEFLKRNNIQAIPNEEENLSFSLTIQESKKFRKAIRRENKALFSPVGLIINGHKGKLKIASSENANTTVCQMEIAPTIDRNYQYVTTDFNLLISTVENVAEETEILSIDQLKTSLLLENDTALLFHSGSPEGENEKWIMLSVETPVVNEGNNNSKKNSKTITEPEVEVF